ncbi:rhamnan synthesis F family protein [uncultured Sphingomonas sp.]|uniref:rhamnan synthesis F family protein n=1 Tax=uncultured Sphingomonas sp. TaxID=158754 RepID=UPI0035C99BB0
MSRARRLYARHRPGARTRWLKRPALAPRPTCVFVTFARGQEVSAHAVHHLRAWTDAGWQTVVVVVSDDPARVRCRDQLASADAVLLRLNSGYDFGAWSDALRRLGPKLRDLPLLATVNDSVFGPLRSFPAMLRTVQETSADVIGLTESRELGRHLQSYLLFFKARALREPVFDLFWRSVRPGDRQFVIDHYETQLLPIMEQAGLTCASLFPLTEGVATNPTLQGWRALIEAGFPYVKVELLRRNPFGADLTGWRALLATEGYDPAIAEAYLRTLPDAIRLD